MNGLMERLKQIPAFELDQIRLNRYREADNLAEELGVSESDMLAACLQLSKRERHARERFDWLRAVAGDRGLGERALRIAIALFDHSGETGYCWPSQRRLGELTGYCDREIRKGISQLEESGFVRRVPVKNLPLDVKPLVVAPVRDGGSGRSSRGIAYAIEIPVTGPNRAASNRPKLGRPNHKVKPQPAPPDSSPTSVGVTQSAFPHVAPLNHLHEGGRNG